MSTWLSMCRERVSSVVYCSLTRLRAWVIVSASDATPMRVPSTERVYTCSSSGMLSRIDPVTEDRDVSTWFFGARAVETETSSWSRE